MAQRTWFGCRPSTEKVKQQWRWRAGPSERGESGEGKEKWNPNHIKCQAQSPSLCIVLLLAARSRLGAVQGECLVLVYER